MGDMHIIRRPKSLRLAALCGACLLALGMAGHAAQPSDIQPISTDPTSNFFSAGGSVSLRQATAIAREHTGGRVLSANSEQRGGRTEHRVRMLINGERVVTVTVDDEGHIKHKR